MNRIVRIWNSLPPLDLDGSFVSLKKSLFTLYWNYFLSSYMIFITVGPGSIILIAPAPTAYHFILKYPILFIVFRHVHLLDSDL